MIELLQLPMLERWEKSETDARLQCRSSVEQWTPSECPNHLIVVVEASVGWIINIPDFWGYLLWRRVGIGEAQGDGLTVVADLGRMKGAGFEVYWDSVTFETVQVVAHGGTRRKEVVRRGMQTFTLAGGRAGVPECTL